MHKNYYLLMLITKEKKEHIFSYIDLYADSKKICYKPDCINLIYKIYIYI